MLDRPALVALPLALVATLSISAAASAQEAARSSGFDLRPASASIPEGGVEVPMIMRGSMPAVEVRVNGEGPFLFAIDTGGQGSARADTSLVETLGLEPVGELSGADPTGRAGRAMPIVELERIELGGAVFEGVEAASRDYNRGVPADMPRIDGILGIHLFGSCGLTLDYAGRRVLLHPGSPEPPASVEVVELVSDPDGVPAIPATVGEHSVELMIDSGYMGRMNLPRSLVGELPHHGEPRVVGRGRTVTGEIEISEVRLDAEVHLAGHVFFDPSVHFSELLDVMIIGSKLLSGTSLTVDGPGQRLWIETYGSLPPERSTVPPEGTVVEMDTQTGWPLVEVWIGDAGPFRFAFDTGAAVTVIDPALVEELGLEAFGTSSLGDFSNPSAHQVEQVLVPEIRVGDARFEHNEAVAWQLPGGAGIRGVLGLPLFTDVLLTLDYPAGELAIRSGSLPAPDGEQVLALRRARSILEIPIGVAGRALHAHLDTGNARSLLFPGSFEGELRLVEGSARKGRGMRASGPVEFTIATLDGAVELGAQRFEQPEVRFDAKITGVNVGYALLKDFAVTIDQRNLAIELARASGEAGDR